MTLLATGKTSVCRGLRCVGNNPENSFLLRYGDSVRVGPFRCTSELPGIRCVVVRSGHGFLIGPRAFRRF